MDLHLDGLHHEGCDVGVGLELGFEGAQIIVGNGLKARHERPKAPKALRICTVSTILSKLVSEIAAEAAVIAQDAAIIAQDAAMTLWYSAAEVT